MSSKLVIQKFENGVNFKSLQITIDDGDNGLSETTFSDWLEGASHQKCKHNIKSSCLVVKIVPEDELDNFNLDLCAKEVTDDQLINTNIFIPNSYGQQNSCNKINVPINKSTKHLGEPEQNLHLMACASNDREQNKANRSIFFDKIGNNEAIKLLESANDGVKSPLEYSLEKVQENNARIMKNIHILNRTLNYTKNKEILDVVCPRSLHSYPCNMCGKCFVYETGLKRHYSMRHAMTEIQPRWQIVWTCIECFQVWPRQDLALKHSSQCCKSDNIDCVREIKTSSLLQCEFCEKVFTSIPRLLRHSKMHTTENNYECNPCDIAFISYKAAERHWLLCPWLKMWYSFSLPKLLLCDACDRKFRNYEQLYNHRYKIGHFTSKYHGNKNNFNPPGILVYQCELCGHWFPSIPSLQAHRAQCRPQYDTGIHCGNVKNYSESQNYYRLSENNGQDVSNFKII